MPKDRAAELRGADGLPECRLALGVVAPETLLHEAEQQAAGIVLWAGAHNDADVHTVAPWGTSEQDALTPKLSAWCPEKLTGADDPRHALHGNSGLADFWYLDDSDICATQWWSFPICKPSTQREALKRQMSFTASQIWTLFPTGRSVKSAPWPPLTQRFTASHSGSQWDHGTASQTNSRRKLMSVIRAMRERVQLCQNPQTEFALLRGSPGVRRINQIFRVHGHTILTEKTAATTF